MQAGAGGCERRPCFLNDLPCLSIADASGRKAGMRATLRNPGESPHAVGGPHGLDVAGVRYSVRSPSACARKEHASYWRKILAGVACLSQSTGKNSELWEKMQFLRCMLAENTISSTRLRGWSDATSGGAGRKAAAMLPARCPQKCREPAAALRPAVNDVGAFHLFERKAGKRPRKPQSPGVRGVTSALLAARGCRLAPLCRRPCFCPRVAAVVNKHNTPPQSARSERVKGGLKGRVAREPFRKSVFSSGVKRLEAGDVSINAFGPLHTSRRRAGESPTPSFCPRCRAALPRQGHLLRFPFYPPNSTPDCFPLPLPGTSPAAARGRGQTVSPCTGSEPPC